MEEKNNDIVASGQQEIYQKWPKIFHAVSAKSSMALIFQSLTGKYLILKPPTIVSPYKRTTYGR